MQSIREIANISFILKKKNENVVLIILLLCIHAHV